MKHIPYLHQIVIIFFLGIFTTGCQKSPINGDLDGFWQVMEINPPLPEGQEPDQRAYMGFYMHVCSLSLYSSDVTHGNMRYVNNMLYLDFPHMTTPGDFYKLHWYGIYSNPVAFEVTFPSKNKMILYDKENDITVYLRRF